MLHGAKKASAGTYIAEQVSTASYEITCASSDKLVRGGLPDCPQLTFSKSYPACNIRSRARAQEFKVQRDNFATLPALASLDALLWAAANAGVADNTRVNPCQRNRIRSEMVEEEAIASDARAKRERRKSEFQRVVRRLMRGELARHGHANEERATPSDLEVLRELTRPLSRHSPQKGGSEFSLAAPPLSTKSHGRRRQHEHYRDAIRHALRGSRQPSRTKLPPILRHTLFGCTSTSTLTRANESMASFKSIAAAEKTSVPETAVNAQPNNLECARDETEGAESAHVDENDPANNILDQYMVAQKIPALRKEASTSLRMLLFGSLTGDIRRTGMSTKDIERILRERIGTKYQVRCIKYFWDKLDEDGSGTVDMPEFRHFVERSIQTIDDVKKDPNSSVTRSNQILGFSMSCFEHGSLDDNLRLAHRLTEKVGQALLGRKSYVVLEDIMRIIWPCSTNSDLRVMRTWCREFAVNSWRAGTPQALSPEEFQALEAVFEEFDTDRNGRVSLEELVASGLMDADQANALMSRVETAGGEMEKKQFCEAFCPTGFRAHSKAKIGSNEHGRVLVYDEQLGCWRFQDTEKLMRY